MKEVGEYLARAKECREMIDRALPDQRKALEEIATLGEARGRAAEKHRPELIELRRNFFRPLAFLEFGGELMSVADLAEEYRAAAEAYHEEAQRCPFPDKRAALEVHANEMEARYLKLIGKPH